MRRRIIAVGVATAAAVALSPASASSLGAVTSTSLLAASYTTGGIVATFNYPAGTSLAATTDLCGDTWQVVGGTFTITAGQTAVSSTSALVTASVPLCGYPNHPNEEVGGDIHSSGSSSFGLLLNAQPGGRAATAALYTNSGAGTLQIERIDAAGVATVWATTTATGGGNTPRFLRFVYLNGVYTASVNNIVLLTYTTSSAQRAAVEAFNEIGIASFSDTKSTFDDLQAYPR